jgi:hypothetical protein
MFKVRVICAILLSLTVTAQNSTLYLNLKCQSETDKIDTIKLRLNITEPDLNCDLSTAILCTFDIKPVSSSFDNDCIAMLKGKINYGNIMYTCSEEKKNEKKTLNNIRSAT